MVIISIFALNCSMPDIRVEENANFKIWFGHWGVSGSSDIVEFPRGAKYRLTGHAA